MPVNIEMTSGEIRLHACTRLTAKAASMADVHWVSVKTQRGEEVTFFMPFREMADAYANAINTVNDQEMLDLSTHSGTPVRSEIIDAREDTCSNG